MFSPVTRELRSKNYMKIFSRTGGSVMVARIRKGDRVMVLAGRDKENGRSLENVRLTTGPCSGVNMVEAQSHRRLLAPGMSRKRQLFCLNLAHGSKRQQTHAHRDKKTGRWTPRPFCQTFRRSDRYIRDLEWLTTGLSNQTFVRHSWNG